jgi:taurine dioxygenase
VADVPSNSEEGAPLVLEVRELMPGFGAEVSGLVPGPQLDEDTCHHLAALMRERELLVFRDLDVDRYFQNYLCEVFRVQGPPDPDIVTSNMLSQETYYVSNHLERAATPFGTLMFHSDASYSTGPYDVLSLWGEEVAPSVEPTYFTSVTQAWATLPAELRAKVDGRLVEQTNQVQNRGVEGDRLLVAVRPERTLTTPVSIVHPRSGRPLLYVSVVATSQILGLDSEESELLLADLFAHIARPEGVWTHEWRNRDLVIWDNLAVQHGRPDVVKGGPVRTLRKATSPAFPDGHLYVQSYGTMTR